MTRFCTDFDMILLDFRMTRFCTDFDMILLDFHMTRSCAVLTCFSHDMVPQHVPPLSFFLSGCRTCQVLENFVGWEAGQCRAGTCN